MPDNPFDQLGLKKELVTYLHQQGKLDEYLKSYIRLNQLHLHPDRGGDTNLSSLVNSAYTSIQEHPEQITPWLATMQNGHNEYKDMLEALVPEMERMQKENDQLREEKSRAYAHQAGSVDAKVRTTPTSTSTPRPTVKTPPRVDPDVRPPPRATTKPRTATPTPASTSDTLIAGKYILMPKTSTYARGVEALREKGISRPLTFKENILARVEAYESGDSRLFDTWLDSCTSIVYKAGTTKFKIVPNCTKLRNIPADFSQPFMPVEYSKIDSIELDSASKFLGKSVKYNELLSKAEILEHPAWLVVVEGDKSLLQTYTNIVFNAYAIKHCASDKLMRFYVREKTAKDELRALFVNNLNYFSNANGISNLSNYGSFLASR